MNLKATIQYARGEKPVDLLVTNARIINVFSGEIISDSIAIAGGKFLGFGDYPHQKQMDAGGRFIAPGLIDGHVHIESSVTCVSEFARTVVARGTTTVAADPHEIANVLGAEGINYMLQSAQDQPMNIYFTLPSCVPATNMETSGAELKAADIQAFMGHERIVALAEMMNFPGVLFRDPDVLAKIEAAKRYKKPVDGHAPGLTGRDLNAYIAAGVRSDHECATAQEAMEKLRAGMHIMIRQGTGAKNLKALIPIVDANNARHFMLCTDDRHPHDLLDDGHIDAVVREAIQQGLDPILAIQLATLNPAEYFGLDHLGAIAPGRQADFVVFSDLNAPIIEQVYHRGVWVAENGKILPAIKRPPAIRMAPSMNVNLEAIDFTLPAEGDRIRVMEIIPDQLITRHCIDQAPLAGKQAVSDSARDLLKIAVVERHTGSGNMGRAFVRGMGLKHGALASSVAHDSHNIIIVGTNDRDMLKALETVIQMGGGLAAVSDAKTLASLPLPVAGLMSLDPIQKVKSQIDQLIAISHEMGSELKDPFMTLSFLALPVIPELKITDLGIIDVNQFKIVPLFVKA